MLISVKTHSNPLDNQKSFFYGLLSLGLELAKKLKKVDLDCPKDFMCLMNCPKLT